MCLAVRTRLELATPCVTGMYSNQTELPDRFGLRPCVANQKSTGFFGCFFSQKRLQKYEHFSNWQKIFYQPPHHSTLNICFLTTTDDKIFFTPPNTTTDKSATQVSQNAIFTSTNALSFSPARWLWRRSGLRCRHRRYRRCAAGRRCPCSSWRRHRLSRRPPERSLLG